MGSPGRPTIRCLRSDLNEGWDDIQQRRQIETGRLPRTPLSDLAHPLIRHVATTFPGTDHDARRENIGGLNDPMFWKAKTGQWRGAIYEDPETGQAWLCAAGFRHAGDAEDFYTNFMSDVLAHGAEEYLPTDDDQVRLQLEQHHAELRAWKTQIAVTAFECIAQCHDNDDGRASVTIPGVGGSDAAIAELEVEMIQDDPGGRDSDASALVELDITVRDWSDPTALETLIYTICAAISPSEDNWDAVPMAGITHYIGTIPEARIHDIVMSVRLDDVPVEPPGAVAPTTHSHYVPSRPIVQALIFGEAVRAVCGKSFVPRRDPSEFPLCPECKSIADEVTD